MKAYQEFLSEREIFILEHHPEMSYKAIGEELGIGPERVRQIKVAAARKVRQEKTREQAAERNKQSVTMTIRRKDLFIIVRGLEAHIHNMQRQRADQRIKNPEEKTDPDYNRTWELVDLFRDILIEKRPMDDLIAEENINT